MTDEDQLMRYVQPDANGCWIWTGTKSHAGYGSKRFRGKQMAAHRAMWILKVGPIPPGMVLCHKCDVKACINPGHLFVGTHADNARDLVSKGKHWTHTVKRHLETCKRGHPMSATNHPRGWRVCLECQRVNSKRQIYYGKRASQAMRTILGAVAASMIFENW